MTLGMKRVVLTSNVEVDACESGPGPASLAQGGFSFQFRTLLAGSPGSVRAEVV